MKGKLLLRFCSVFALAVLLTITVSARVTAFADPNPSDTKADPDNVDQRTITGKITSDESKEGIPGVNVVVKGTTTGVITDFDGNYSLVMPRDEATLVISAVGYVSQEINYVGVRSTINVVLKSDVTALDEVVVIGYGTSQKKDLTGAVVNVQAEQIEKYKPSSVSEILRSAVPGLQVGYATNAKMVPDFEVRADASLKADIDGQNGDDEEREANKPLIVLDGVIFRGDLAEINPNTIASVDVLKDASSAAVYGSQASNGVIIFTTKKGAYGKPQINFSSRFGLVTGARRLKTHQGTEAVSEWLTDVFETVENSATDPVSQYDDYYGLTSDLQSQWLSLNNLTAGATDDEIRRARALNFGLEQNELENYMAGIDYDWQDFLFHTGIRQDYDVSVSGRTERVSYYFSAGYSSRESVQVGETFETITSRLNLDVNLAEFLNIGVNGQFAFQDDGQEAISNGGYRTSSVWDQPWENGVPRTVENLKASRAGSNQGNEYLNPSYNSRLYTTFAVNPTMFAKFTLPFGFSIRQDYTPRFEFRKRFDFDDAKNPNTAIDFVRRRHNESFEWQSNTILNWDKAFGDHRFSVTGLYNTEKNQNWFTDAQNRDFQPTPSLGYGGIGLGVNPFVDGNDETNTRIGIMGRVNYSFSNRYNFTASMRRDGYSRFGAENLWANFPAIAAGWTVTNESFMPATNLLSYLKLRASWGVNGNSRGLEAYNAYAQLGSGLWLNYDGGYNATPWTSLDRFALPGLSWERTASFNVGIDFGLFNDRVSGTLDMYQSETTDLILDQKLPEVTGFESAKNNVGNLKNSGFDLGINTRNITTNNLFWTTSFNVTYAINEITSLGNEPSEQLDGTFRESDDLQNGWFIGENKDVIWELETDGVYKIGEETEAAVFGLRPGDFRHVDKDGDGVISVDDRTFQGLTQAPWYITLRNDVEFMGFDLGIVLLSKLGWNGTTVMPFNWEQQYIKNRNWFDIPYWMPDNQIDNAAKIQSIRLLDIQAVQPKDYLRIQNISLGYSLPASMLEKVNFSRVRIAVNVENAAVFTPWIYGDPENEREMPRNYSFSLDFSF